MLKRKVCTYGGCNATVITDESDRNPPRCPRHQGAQSFTPKKVYHDHQWHKARYFYTSAEWKRLREQYINAHPLCEICDAGGRVTPATEVDHIVEIQDGGDKTNLDNLQSLCTSCHRRKTGEERRKREERKNLNGFNSLSDF